MTMSRGRAQCVWLGSLLMAGTIVVATGTRSSDLAPLIGSAGPPSDERGPITMGNPAVRQWSVADRESQLLALKPNSRSWDMNTVNETGAHEGRYLFTVFETGEPGVQRRDLLTGETETIWQSPAAGTHTSFDAAYWTPWGTFITAEESWSQPGSPGYPTRFGRLLLTLSR